MGYFAGTFSIFNAEIGIPVFPQELDNYSQSWHAVLRTYHFSGSYGIFRHMTGVEGREEIVIFGSEDLHNWKVYEFYHKPTKTNIMPTFIAPHQPRLAWHLWFTASNSGDKNSEFYLNNLMFKIFQNSASVKTLIAKNPFPNSPPSYLKFSKIKYSFTSLDSVKPGEMGNLMLSVLLNAVDGYTGKILNLAQYTESNFKWWKAGTKRKSNRGPISKNSFGIKDELSEYPIHPMQDIPLVMIFTGYTFSLLFVRIVKNLR
mmetsp:Transcript_22654/g.25177  ORF Transcript_22654/g.25177 Transcript_22654/m.25177 type:complete len:259 (+) Transcript_22654:95-871(+)